MKSLAVFLVLFYLAAGAVPNQVRFNPREVTNLSISEVEVNSRIFEGHDTSFKDVNYMIFVLIRHMKDGIFMCSGTLVSTEMVLLSGNCVDPKMTKPEDYILVAGTENLENYLIKRLETRFNDSLDNFDNLVQERRAKKLYRHPDFNNMTLHHDVAFIKLEKPFKNDTVKFIHIAKDKINAKNNFTLVGWGMDTTNEAYLRRVDTATVKDYGHCVFKNEGPFICLSGTQNGFCMGDSGAPLIFNKTVYAVASHAINPQGVNHGCGSAFEYYFSDLSADMDWIDSVMSGSSISSMVNLTGILTCTLFSIVLSRRW